MSKVKETKVEEVVETVVEKEDKGTSIYIGPTIIGTIQNNTIYPCSVKEALKLPLVKMAIAEYTNIDKLIIPVEESIEKIVSIKDKKSDIYKLYVGVKKK